MKTDAIQKKCLATFLGFAMAVSAYSQALAPVQDRPGGPFYMPGELLIKFKPDVSDQQLGEVVRLAGVNSARQIHTPVMKAKGDNGITRAFINGPVLQAIRAITNHPAVLYAEPNWVYKHQFVANDTYFMSGNLWGMYGDASYPANRFGSQAAEAWAEGYTGGENEVVVGIIDEGIQITHRDLAANIWVNPGEIAGNGMDDDDNGYIDDINGWDFFENNSSVYDGTVDDHGTHVAGTIGAVANGDGVVGVSWGVKMIPGKFLGPNGGDTVDAIEAVDYFIALKQRGVNIVALNNSWGGGGYSDALNGAIGRAADAGILFVAAAGNGDPITGEAINTDGNPFYPACYNSDAIVSVTAIDSGGNKASWANYGITTVDLGAPGVSINSTLPTDGYGLGSGTSMATPHVTGAIALYASTHPGATPPEIKSAILNAVARTDSLLDATVTGGRLDLSTVIAPNTPPPAPTAPTGLAATAINSSEIRLTWTDAQYESRYEIDRTPTSGGDTTTIPVGANLTSFIDSGLSPGTQYSYAIRACNSGSCTDGGNPIAPTATTEALQTAVVTFVGEDTTTQGNWIGKYGTDGYDIVRFKDSLDHGTVKVVGSDTCDPWAQPADNERDLQDPLYGYRFSACYFKEGEFYFDVNLGAGAHRVSLYCVDRDNLGRKQNITIIDPSDGRELAKYPLTSFSGGQYLTWDITGHVYIRITWIDNRKSRVDNAVVSGIFFDPVPSGSPNVLPTADFTASASGLTVSFNDASTDSDGSISTWHWAFGDGKSDTTQNPTHAYSQSGTYPVTLTVTDNAGGSRSVTKTVTVTDSVTPSIYCAELEGSSSSSGNFWTATVIATIKDMSGQPVSGATVTGVWSGGYKATVTGVTGNDGKARFTSASMLSRKTSSVTFIITDVTAAGYAYYSAAPNNKTSITISKQ